MRKGLAAAAAYIAVVVLANVASSRWGLVPIGFGLMASAGTYFAGAALGLRDVVQDGLGKLGSVGVIIIASILSYLLADPFIATASFVAFAVGEFADLGVYTPLRKRGFARAVLASNVVGGALDTIVFLYIAPFPLTLTSFTGQMVGKVLWMTIAPLVLLWLAQPLFTRGRHEAQATA